MLDLACIAKKNLCPLKWVGSSKKDLMQFPNEVKREVGYALYVAQKGDVHDFAKIFKGCGSGVYEIVSNFDTNAYRAIYIVKLNENVYVLHAFPKKSKKGVKTPKEEINVIKERLKRLKASLVSEKKLKYSVLDSKQEEILI